MVSDEVTIHHVLRVLDRLSSKTLDCAVLQFKDHTQRFHESISELKGLKLPTEEGLYNGFAHPLNLGGDLSFSHSVQAKCTPLKPPLNSSVVQEGIENYGSKQYTLQSQVNCTPSKPPFNSTVVQEGTETYGSKQYTLQSQVQCTPSKPPFNSTVVQEGTENYGSKTYTLRSRAPRKLSTTNAPQRITRSRAKQPVAAGTAAACNNLPKAEFTVLQDDFIEVRNKRDREPQQHQLVSSQGGFPTEVAVSDCKRALSPGRHELQLHDTAAATASIATEASHKQSKSSVKKLSTPTSIQVSKNSAKERSGLKDAALGMNQTEQFCLLPDSSEHNILSKMSISATPCQSIPKCDLRICGEAPLSQVHGEVAGSSSLVQKSNSKGMEGILSRIHDGKSVPPESADVTTNGVTSRCGELEESIVPTHEVESHREDELIVLEHSCSFVSERDHSNRVSSPVHSSARLQAEQEDVSSSMECILSGRHDKKAESAEVTTVGATPRCEQIEENIVRRHEVEPHGEDELKVLEHSSSFVSEREHSNWVRSPVLSASRLQVEQEDVSSSMECILSVVHDRRSAPPESAEVTTDGVTPRCEQIEGNIVPTHEVEPHCEDEHSVPEREHSIGVSSPVHSASRLQVEQEDVSSLMECILSGIHEDKCAPPESAEVTTDGVTPRCEQIEESIVPTHEVEPHHEDGLEVLEHSSSFVSERKHSNGVSSPVHSSARLQVEQEDVSSSTECIFNGIHDEKSAPPESAEVTTDGTTPRCEQVEESIVPIHEVERQGEDELKVLEHSSSFVAEHEHSNGVSSPVHSAARLQVEQEDVSSSHNKEVSLLKPVQGVHGCLYEHVEEKLTSCSKLEDSNHHMQPEDYDNQTNACEELHSLVLNAHSNQGTSAGSSPARLQLEQNGTVSLFQRVSPQAALQAVALTSCELGEGSLTSTFILAHHSTEALALENLSMQQSSIIHRTSPILSGKGEEASDTEMAGLMPQVKESENCGREVKLEKPCSQVIESEFPELCQKSPSKGDSLGRLPSAVKNGPSIEWSKCIPDVETKEGTDHETDNGDDISDTESQMDCSESPMPSDTVKDNDTNEGKLCENESPNEWRATPKGDDGFLKFTELLAQGTVNSSRRKRARSPAICTEECKDLKRMKLLSTGEGEQFKERLPHTLYSQSPTFGSSMYGFPHFSSVRKFQDTFGMTFGDSPSKSIDEGDFYSLQRQIMGSRKLSKSYSRLPTLQKDYLDTPHVKSVRAGLVDRASIKSSKQKSDCHLITHLEEDGKENQSPKTFNRGSNTSILSDWQVPTDTRKVLGHANHSLGQIESPHKRYNLAVGTGSFLDLVQQKQLPLPYPNGKREVRVKALEAAEHARKQEEQREIERKRRRLECVGVDSDSATDKLQRVTYKVKRAAELKIKMDQEKARKQEVEQRKKEEERKKKEAEFADKKRKREDADKRDREEKRKRVEEVQRFRKEQEERQRVELNEKELRRKVQDERERERKAQEEEAKRQRRLEKEKEAERRRKQDEHLKAARFAGKQAERKRKEAMLLQARANEDDDFIAQIPLGNKLSFLSTESFAVSTSNDWEAQSKSVLGTRSQTSGDKWGLRVPSLGTSAYCQNNSEKLTSLVENGPFFSSKQDISGLGSKCQPFKSLSYTTPSNTRADVYAPARLVPPEIQSYEISPYKSSSDDEDDDQPKRPVPPWARNENLLQQLLCQQRVNPDCIFSSAKTCSLAEIFGTTGSRRCKDFTKRSASGDWLVDHATWKEELDYKKEMGYM